MFVFLICFQCSGKVVEWSICLFILFNQVVWQCYTRFICLSLVIASINENHSELMEFLLDFKGISVCSTLRQPHPVGITAPWLHPLLQ